MRKHILYLASGSSRRFGENKLLYPLNGRPLYRHGLETLLEVSGSRPDCSVTVVSRYAPIRAFAENAGLRAADSPDSDSGISHTIRAGILALEHVAPEDFLLFATADQPWISAASVMRLLDMAGADTECACLSWEGQPGNPTLFSARLIPELLALEGDTGGRAVQKRHRCRLVSVESPRELADIDTLDDLPRAP